MSTSTSVQQKTSKKQVAAFAVKGFWTENRLRLLLLINTRLLTKDRLFCSVSKGVSKDGRGHHLKIVYPGRNGEEGMDTNGGFERHVVHGPIDASVKIAE